MGMYEVIKDAAKAAQKADNIDLYKTLLDAQQMALDTQEKLQNCATKISKLEAVNEELRKRIAAKDSYVLENHVYWKIDDENRTQPFCPTCMAKGLEIPMQPDKQNTRETRFRCQNSDCKNVANPWDYHPQPHKPQRHRGMFSPDTRY
jgi:hypothetical protein